jgi:hypothetical protein
MGKWTTIAEAAIEVLAKRKGGALPDTTLPIRPARENLRTVVDSNTIGGRVSGDEMVPIDSLSGGPSLSARGQKAVDDIVEQMSGPDGFIERLIVDQDNNVIEGAHRVEALRRLGIEQVPITRVIDPTANLDLPKMGEAIKAVGPIHSDHVNQITAQVGDMLAEVGGDPAKVLQEFDLPKGFERFFRAALDSVSPKTLPTDEASRMARRKRTDDLRAEANALRFGDSYKMQHTAPDAGSSPTGEDLSDVFPDIYGPMGKRYYGTSSPYDDEAISKIQAMRGNPDSEITIYRAVPQDVKEINPGDWVTTTKEYAVDHIGTDDGYTVISKKVKAGELANNGDSIHEFGFSPKTLPTDEASRMARAREMGRTAEGYHGTDADISEFGGPTWITDDPEVGSYYAQRARARTAMSDAADDTGLYDEVMDVDEVNPFDVAEAVDPTGKNVMPLKYDQGKQLDMTSLGDAPAPEELIEFLVERGIIKRPDDIGDWLNELTVDQPTLWKAIEDWGLDRDIKNAGYDSLKIKDIVSAKKGTIGQDSVLVFDPKNIRSRFAKFDPAKADSADILAGLGVVGAGAALSQQDGFDYGALSNVVEGSNGQRSN